MSHAVLSAIHVRTITSGSGPVARSVIALCETEYLEGPVSAIQDCGGVGDAEPHGDIALRAARGPPGPAPEANARISSWWTEYTGPSVLHRIPRGTASPESAASW